MYGTQTLVQNFRIDKWFENDVKMYGTQTIVLPFGTPPPFENDVKMYGTQTEQERCQCVSCLRMM